MQNNIAKIIKKLDDFIRKYYLNQLIRGSISFLTIGILLSLLVLFLEYFGQFSSQIRTILFYSSLSILGLIFIYYILIPLGHFLRIGSTISREEASKIIGKHFGEVSDKLQNLLQLSREVKEKESDLLMASIDQKVEQLQPIPFTLAVKLGENKRYLKYLIIPLIIFLLTLFIQPQLISESSGRLIAHNKEFVPTAPYVLEIENDQLRAFKNEDFKLSVRANGKEIPQRLMLVYKGESYLMNRSSTNLFHYQFKNLQTDLEFHFYDGTFDSPGYAIEVVTPPTLIDFRIEANYPDYLGKADETFYNTGDLSVPQGSRLRWSLQTEAAESMHFIGMDSSYAIMPSGENEFTYADRFFKSQKYGLALENTSIAQTDTIYYRLNIIPDLRPQISLDKVNDSSNANRIYFEGSIRDDHGFSALYFHSKLLDDNDSLKGKSKLKLPINTQLNQSSFYYAWDIGQFDLKAGDELQYYFEVWDNDAVNGRKSSRTAMRSYSTPSREEVEKETQKSNQKIKDELIKNIALSKEINRELESLKEKMLNKKELSYQEKKKVESLLNKQKELQQSVEKIKNLQKSKNRMNERFSKEDEALMEKQKELEDLFEKIMTDEMKAMLEEMQKLMEKFEKEKLQEAVEKMELNNQQLEKELDRNLELFKQLEVEKELAESIEKLEELKKNQKELQKQQEKDQDNQKNEKSKKEQEELNKEFDKLDKKLDELYKKNQELESPNPMKNTQSKEDQIKEDMKKSLEQLSKGDPSGASEQQEEAGEKMEELSESLMSMQSQMQSQQQAENLEDLRALLENLITLSFEQEDLMQDLKTTERDDPRYVELAQQQRKLQDDSKVIEDSLFALSKRVMALESVVNREISKINYNMEKAIDYLGERNTGMANSRQQLTMTSINNLALLLDEAVQSMMKQMQSAGQCKKPGQGGNPKPGMGQKPGNLKSLQKQLNQQLQSLKKSMQEGRKKGPGKKGSGKGMPGMSKELAQMAAKQAAIRKAIEDMQQKIGESNSGAAGNLKKLSEMMEETETDLVNKSITNETLLRQQQIMSRLLESEKAEREREKEKRRESEEFTDQFNRNPDAILEYNRRKEKEIELLQTLPPSFSPFYKSKVTDYFNKIEK